MSARQIYLVSLAVIIGCAPASGTPGSSSQAGGPRRSNVLSAQEIATLQADVPTAYDIVARLRPSWMTARGVTSLGGDVEMSERALVFVDGHHHGNLEALRNIQSYQIEDIRVLQRRGGRCEIRGDGRQDWRHRSQDEKPFPAVTCSRPRGIA